MIFGDDRLQQPVSFDVQSSDKLVIFNNAIDVALFVKPVSRIAMRRLQRI
jgi:hypothetical protein